MITVKDDKKKKYQSVEATLEINFMTGMGDGSLHLTGYGENEAEARKELKNSWERLLVEYEKKQ